MNDVKPMTAEQISMSKVRMFCLDMATKNNTFLNNDGANEPKSSDILLADAQKYFDFIKGKTE